MNLKIVSLIVLVLVLLTGFLGCSGSMEKQLETIETLIRTSDSVSFDLEPIDSVQVETLFSGASDVKEQFKAQLGNDTLELEFAEHLNEFLTAISNLEGLNAEKETCYVANAKTRGRLRQLRSDISSGSGERARYASWLAREQAEIMRIRKHCITIKRKFESAKSAIEQYQPEIERFIQQSVP
jgi:hypothetical protein